MNQAALTIVVEIPGAERASLLSELTSIQREVRGGRTRAAQGARFPFADLTTVHFARFVVLDPPAPRPPDTEPDGPRLVFATVHDGSRDQHLDELVAVAGEGLLSVFSLCDKTLQRDRLREFLTRRVVESKTFWGGHRGRSVGQIRAESRLHDELDWALGPSSGRLSSDPFAEALDFVRGRADLRWALSPPDPTRLPWYRKALLLGTFLLCGFARLWMLLLVPWLRALELRDARNARKQKQEDPVTAREEERAHKRSLLADEDRHVQNQMTAITDVKPGFVRLRALCAVLWVLDFLGRFLWDNGTLAGIRTIHFARWFLVKQGRKCRLVFLSNYDGSWENYLGEFVDRAASGLTGVWSNTDGFPETRWLICGGARRELRFKRWVRQRQVETQVWYSAYPDLSVANVQNNSEIRRGLSGLRGFEERQAWLRRI